MAHSGPASPLRPAPRGKRTWAAPLADFVAPCIAPAVAKQGFAASEIILHWPEIVGSRLAAVCEPVRLQWPRRAGGPASKQASRAASLVLRVEGAFAVELQHLADVVIERANAHLGWRCIGRIAFRQGPLQRKARASRERSPAAPAAAARAAAMTANIEDAPLREALARLGAEVLSNNMS